MTPQIPPIDTSSIMKNLLFHGIIGNPSNPTKCIRYAISIEINPEIVVQLLDPTGREPTQEEINSIKTAIEGVVPNLGSNVLLLGVGRKCCICNKSNIPKSCYHPFNLDHDIRVAWSWMTNEKKTAAFTFSEKGGVETAKLMPQVWSRVFPVCEGSEFCQRGAEIMARSWKMNDVNLRRGVIIESWLRGMEAIVENREDMVFSKIPTSVPIVICNGCGRIDATMKCGGCKIATYCSKVCQTKDWTGHSKVCKVVGPSVGFDPSTDVQNRLTNPLRASYTAPPPPYEAPQIPIRTSSIGVPQASTSEPNTPELSMADLATALPAIRAPGRAIHIDGLTLAEVNKNKTPAPKVLIHGICGNPTINDNSEIFRIVLPILPALAELTMDTATEPRGQDVLLELIQCFETLFTERLAWHCVSCGEETTKFAHDLVYNDQGTGEKEALLSYIWSYMTPVCDGKKNCEKEVKKLVEDYKKEPGAAAEIKQSLVDGSKKYWIEEERRVKRAAQASEAQPEPEVVGVSFG